MTIKVTARSLAFLDSKWGAIIVTDHLTEWFSMSTVNRVARRDRGRCLDMVSNKGRKFCRCSRVIGGRTRWMRNTENAFDDRPTFKRLKGIICHENNFCLVLFRFIGAKREINVFFSKFVSSAQMGMGMNLKDYMTANFGTYPATEKICLENLKNLPWRLEIKFGRKLEILQLPY